MAIKKYDAVATIGTYTDKSGAEKKRYLNVGTVFESDKGLSLKLDAIPVVQDWNGWISFFEPKERSSAPPEPQRQQRQAPRAASSSGAFADLEDDIPFN